MFGEKSIVSSERKEMRNTVKASHIRQI